MTNPTAISNCHVSETVYPFQKRFINLITFGAHFFWHQQLPERNLEHLEVNSKTLCAPQIDGPWGPHTKFMNAARTGRQALWESLIHTDTGVELALWPLPSAPTSWTRKASLWRCAGQASPCGGDCGPDIKFNNSVLSLNWGLAREGVSDHVIGIVLL